MRVRAAVLVLGALLLSIPVVGCGKGGGGGGGESGSDTVQLGAALSLTGSLAREGLLTKQGYEVCKDQVNKKGGIPVGGTKMKLAITYKDDKSEPDTASQLVDQFNDQDMKLILGPYGSSSTAAAAAVVERNGQVMVDSAGADNTIFSKGYQRTFAVLSPATEYTAAIIKAVADEASPKPKTVAFLSADDGFSKTATKGGIQAAKQAGMDVVATEYFPEHTTDVSSSLTKIRGKHPDLIIGSVHVEEGIAIIKQSGELGVKPQGFGETVAPPTPDFRKALGDSANGVLGSTQWTPESTGQDKYLGSAKDYVDEFQAKYNAVPEYHAAEASAACLAFALAIEKAGSTDPDKVRQSLAGLDEQSFFGQIKFDKTGKNVTKPMSVIQIRNGDLVTVWPKDQQEKPMTWPAR